ncbi:M61 family peptidase [Hymenobacter sp. HMF4947]|uniref:M61 family peptidase n=1 Tax=Hymenobacter ginkgonis TaxID=2682976 RepID=A0A7K1TG07_9BACT|nr:M61 family peptidase [Hymenobacter ginkgonis]MVN77101.1 M61 family peptidase [Hymenobacter ginkgonis]
MKKLFRKSLLGAVGTLLLPNLATAQTATPPATKAAVAKPVASKAAVVKPVTAKPAVAKPALAKPVTAAKPLVTKPAAAKPAIAKPVVAKPVVAPAAKPAPAVVVAPAEAPVTATVEAPPKPTPVAPAALGPAVHYTVSFPNAVHHEARIAATFAGLPPGQKAVVRMARSSPGRYALHDFIKNVYYAVATDTNGKLLAVNRPDPYSWEITPGADGIIKFDYTLYGDLTDGTFSGIDQQHAHLNIPATFCYVQGLESRAAEVKFELPATWKVATQLRAAGDDKTTFTAPNLQYFMDSPIVLGAPQILHTWQDGGRNFEMATYYSGPVSEVDAFVKKTQKVVRESAGVYGGEFPQFDFNRYTFLADYLPQASGDGMEHRNSTSLTSPLPLREEGGLRNLGTVSHEFFHAYNTERIRSQGLEPFDFQRVNMSDALWFGEGFTQYYGELVLRRAGFYTDEQFYNKVSSWVNARINSPGARYASAVDMSRQAGFVDAAVSVDPTNRNNTYLSYYIQGAGLALVLDLQLRQRFHTSLDKYMQAMWQEFGKPQTPALAPVKGYTVADLQRVLGTVAKDTAFAGNFFRRYIYGHETPRFAENLGTMGLAVVPVKALAAALPRQVEFDEEDRCILSHNTTIGSGLYKAGIDRGDQIVMLDGEKIDNMATLEAIMRRHTPADLVPVKVRNRAGVERTTQVVLTEDTNIQVQPMETVEKMTATTAQKEQRAAWLAATATTAAPTPIK